MAHGIPVIPKMPGGKTAVDFDRSTSRGSLPFPPFFLLSYSEDQNMALHFQRIARPWRYFIRTIFLISEKVPDRIRKK